MSFLTDFADQAVVLPLWLALGAVLALAGWRRGAAAWLIAVGATLAVVGLGKLAGIACGPVWLRSPSGHTAAAGVVAGGLAVLAGWEQVPVLLAGAAGAALIGLTRLLLGAHTGAEVGVGAALGLLGAALLGRWAGKPPERLKQRWLLAIVAVVLVLFHGMRLPAEPRLWAAAHALGVCRTR